MHIHVSRICTVFLVNVEQTSDGGQDSLKHVRQPMHSQQSSIYHVHIARCYGTRCMQLRYVIVP
jgi:hypothetical protein